MPGLTAAESARPDVEGTGPAAERLLAALVIGRADPREVSDRDAAALVPLAVLHGLGPALLAAVRAVRIETADTVWEPLAEHARGVASRYLLARVEQARIEAVLAPLGIDWVWLKGYALAHSVYPRPAMRPMVDLDLLVPAERADEAERAVRGLGYRPAVDAPPMFAGADRISHHRPPLRAPGGVFVEMHTGLHPSELLLPAAHLAWFRARTTETHSAGVRVRHLEPEAQLLHLAAHAILQHGEGDLRLQRFYDCHLLLTRTPRLDWDVLLDRAATLGWTYAVERALAIAHDYFATPVPGHVWRALREPRPQTAQATRAKRLADALARARVPSVRGNALGVAPSVSFGLYVGLRKLVPSPAYMRWRYAADAWRLPLAYLRRWRDIARRFFDRRRGPGT